MKTEDKGSYNPHTPNVSKARRFVEVFVIMSVTSLITNTFEDIFFTQVDNRSVLHYVVFLSLYMSFYFLYEKYRSW